MYTEGNPVLLGFDVVHYHFIPSFEQGGVAQQGSSEFAYNFQGYQFWFLNQTNRDLFINDPWKYAPAWGGFCSWGIALELPPAWPWEPSHLGPPASPWEGWAIVDGVLIFNIWHDFTRKFMRNVDENMKLAAERWKDFFDGELYSGPFNTHCIGHGSLKNWCLSPQPSPWLKPLPECHIVVDDGTNSTTNGTVQLEGGGIVSELDEFESFSNSSISPYYRNWIIGGSVCGFFVLLLMGFTVVWKCKNRMPNRGGDDADEEQGVKAVNEDDIEPQEDEDDTSHHTPDESPGNSVNSDESLEA